MKSFMAISNEQKLYDSFVAHYPDAMQSITQLSKNTDANKNFVICDYQGFNFDVVNNVHSEQDKKEKSPDGLFYCDGYLYLVEFKESTFKKLDVRAKAHEAMLTLYQFNLRFGPKLSREAFFALNVKFALVARFQTRGNQPTFANTLEQTYNNSHLGNMQGFLYQDTRVLCDPELIYKLFSKLSGGQVSTLTVHDHFGQDANVRSA